ncbi:hypothetical protein HMI56_001288 [Coelomomyces lativittatus]|nr:hypothetical protein HMI56_001288 [Coelomomyces lativittatus]
MMAQKLPTTTLALTLSQFGIPEKVLKFSTIPLERWTESKVLIKFLASPINPSDINAIQGVYPVKLAKAENKELFIPGFEGVARVTAVGRDVKDINVDDLVLPSSSGIGLPFFPHKY